MGAEGGEGKGGRRRGRRAGVFLFLFDGGRGGRRSTRGERRCSCCCCSSLHAVYRRSCLYACSTACDREEHARRGRERHFFPPEERERGFDNFVARRSIEKMSERVIFFAVFFLACSTFQCSLLLRWRGQPRLASPPRLLAASAQSQRYLHQYATRARLQADDASAPPLSLCRPRCRRSY